MKNPYAYVIDTLKNISPEASRDLLFEIAKKNPGVIVKATVPVLDQISSPLPGPFARICQMILDGQHIHAIKEIRSIANLGLAESKNFADTLKVLLLSRQE